MGVPERVKDATVQGWLHKAAHDMTAGQVLLAAEPPVVYAACCHAHQAATGYLMALLSLYGVEFPRTHSIKKLLGLLQPVDDPAASELEVAVSLTAHGAAQHMPGEHQLKLGDAYEALGLANLVQEAVLWRVHFAEEFPEQPLESLVKHLRSGTRVDSALQRAQQLIYDAWEAPTRERVVALATRALEVSPDCADAYVLLGEYTAKTFDQAIKLYTAGVKAGERAISEGTFPVGAGHFWGVVETRPYMRARAALAESLRESGQREEAAEHCQELLRLNPRDNQGIRYLLMACLIELGQDKEAARLWRQYKGERTAEWAYTRVLLTFRQHGDSARTRAVLKRALASNQFVPSYLLRRKRVPRQLPDAYGFGTAEEAACYAHRYRATWQSVPGALALLDAAIAGG
ncbi:MAG: HEPN domain-containing protein [Bacillota bacterium]